MKQIKAKFWIIIVFKTYYTWMIFFDGIFQHVNLKTDLQHRVFGIDNFFNNITEILAASIGN